MPAINSLCVFCGSADDLNTEYMDSAHAVGSMLAAEGITLVFGGGRTGLMGAAATGCLAAGGRMVGVITPELDTPSLAFANGFEKVVMPDLDSRKTRMRDLADGFIILPGGFGTLDEFFSTLTLAQLGLHDKPIGLLNTRSYFDPLMAVLKHALAEAFIYPEHLQLFRVENQPEQLLAALRAYQLPDRLTRWVDREKSID